MIDAAVDGVIDVVAVNGIASLRMRSWATNIIVTEDIQLVSSAGKQKITVAAVREITECRSTAGPMRLFYRGQSPCFKYLQSEPQCLLQNPVAYPVRRTDFAVRKVHHGETKISGDTGILVTLLIGRTRMRQLLTVILGYVQILGHILTAWVRHQANVQYLL